MKPMNKFAIVFVVRLLCKYFQTDKDERRDLTEITYLGLQNYLIFTVQRCVLINNRLGSI